MDSTLRSMRIVAAATAATMLVGACMVGPTYQRALSATAERFKAAEGWVDAAPADALDRGPWWTLFDDPVLDALVARVEVTNQNVAAAVAVYAQARALVSEQRASLFPAVVLDGGASRAGTGVGGDAQAISAYRVGIGAGWEPDVWGRLRRSVDSASAIAQASEADVASARLATQGELVANYFGVR